MTQVHVVKISKNVKVGRMPITNSESKTCPKSCPFRNKGCYAKAGFHTRLNWEKVDSHERGGNWDTMCQEISGFKSGIVWRHNIVGDLPHTNEVINESDVKQLVEANSGKMGFTYTHHNMDDVRNRSIVEFANNNGFTVNLSADNLAHADKLAGLNIGPVASVLPSDHVGNTVTPNGRKVVVCPAITKENVTCKSCKLCARSNRSVIVGFPAHGNQKNATLI